MHAHFTDLLNEYTISDSLVQPLKQETAAVYHELCKESIEYTATLQAQHAELQTKLDSIEEKYFVTGEMSKETFEKLVSDTRVNWLQLRKSRAN